MRDLLIAKGRYSFRQRGVQALQVVSATSEGVNRLMESDIKNVSLADSDSQDELMSIRV